MRLKRRRFLQQSTLGLAALAVGELGIFPIAKRYQHALAQPTQRKLALLIGINQYPEQVSDLMPIKGTALLGCLTDVELQRELLIHRFGFQPGDILTLVNQAATRSNIVTAFLSHLTNQTRAGDVVVVHFSGLGSQVRLSDAPEILQNSLVPVDGVLPTEDYPDLNDLLEESLVLLLRSLPTDQVTTLLDLSYSHSGKVLSHHLRIRSRLTTPMGSVSSYERELQAQLLSQMNLSREMFQFKSHFNHVPGVLLGAAQPRQGAIEGYWNGFSAGLFTYALTQQLWWMTPATTLRICLSRAARTIDQMVGRQQQPYCAGQKTREATLSPFFLAPSPPCGADGVIVGLDEEGLTAQIWLAGLPASVLDYYSTNSLLALEDSATGLRTIRAKAEPNPSAGQALPAQPTAPVMLQVRSRDGLNVVAKLCCSPPAVSPLRVGQFVQEAVRILPKNIGLIIALDSSLERIERVDATSAFAAIPKVSTIVAGEQPADFLFGRASSLEHTVAAWDATQTTASLAQSTPSPSPSKWGYGLFDLGRSVIPGTLVQGDGAIKTAINRIAPKLRILLANKLLRLTSNQGSSRLGIRATLEMIAPQERIVMQQETIRAVNTPTPGKLANLFARTGEVPTIPISSRIRYRLQNYSDRPVYFTLLGLENNGNAIALCPPSQTVAGQDLPAPTGCLIPPGETLLIPQFLSPIEWVVNGPIGLVETHLILSTLPLQQTYTTLQSKAIPNNATYRLNAIPNPLEVAQAVLQDLHQPNSVSNKTDAPTDVYALDMGTWATLSFIYEVTENSSQTAAI
jgi:hypothetical protein